MSYSVTSNNSSAACEDGASPGAFTTEGMGSAPEVQLSSGTFFGSSTQPNKKICRLPKDPGADFVGRRDILEELGDPLVEGDRFLLLHGPPDIGKKETTLQFAVKARYDCILYINCAEQDIMESDLRAICSDLGLIEPPDCAGYSSNIFKLTEHLKQRPDFLLILANCQEDMLKMLQTNTSPMRCLITCLSNGKIILTTSLTEALWVPVGLKYKPVEVRPFDVSESKALISKWLQHIHCEEEDYRKLHDFAEGSPSVLKRVLLGIVRKKKTIKEFFSTPAENGDPFGPDKMDLGDFVRINETPVLRSVFYLLCLLSPHTPITLDALRLGLPEAMKSNLGTKCEHARELVQLAHRLSESGKTEACSFLKDILEPAITHQLLTVTGKDMELVKVPRIIQRKYLWFVSGKSCCDPFIQRMACLCLTEAMQHDGMHSQLLVPHLKAVLGHNCDDAPLFTFSWPISCHSQALLARHYVEDGRFNSVAKLLSRRDNSAASRLVRHIRRLARRHRRPVFEEIRGIACLAWLGRTYVWLGLFAQAIEILEEAEELSVSLSSLEHAVILTHLGSAWTEAGHSEKAKDKFDRAFAIFKETDGSPVVDCCDLGLFVGEQPEAYLHARFGKYLRREMYQCLAKLTTAERVIQESVNHFTEARNRYKNSNRCQELIMNMYIEVQEIHLIQEGTEGDTDGDRLSRCQEIVKELKQLLRQDHHHVGWAQIKLGWVHSQTFPDSEDELHKAVDELEEGLDITRNTYGANHRKVGNAYRLKACVLHNMGQIDQASKCLRKAKSILEKKQPNVANDPKLKLINEKLAQLKGGKRSF